MTYLPVTEGLLAQNLNEYSDTCALAKRTFHSHGKSFLSLLAKELSLPPGSYSLRANLGGPAGSGELILHAERLYVQLMERSIGPKGILMLYRSCEGQQDMAGGPNHFVYMHDFKDSCRQEHVLRTMRELTEFA